MHFSAGQNSQWSGLTRVNLWAKAKQQKEERVGGTSKEKYESKWNKYKTGDKEHTRMRNLQRSKTNTAISCQVLVCSYIHFRKPKHTVLQFLWGWVIRCRRRTLRHCYKHIWFYFRHTMGNRNRLTGDLLQHTGSLFCYLCLLEARHVLTDVLDRQYKATYVYITHKVLWITISGKLLDLYLGGIQLKPCPLSYCERLTSFACLGKHESSRLLTFGEHCTHTAASSLSRDLLCRGLSCTDCRQVIPQLLTVINGASTGALAAG
jgi:hypothetical protein